MPYLCWNIIEFSRQWIIFSQYPPLEEGNTQSPPADDLFFIVHLTKMIILLSFFGSFGNRSRQVSFFFLFFLYLNKKDWNFLRGWKKIQHITGDMCRQLENGYRNRPTFLLCVWKLKRRFYLSIISLVMSKLYAKLYWIFNVKTLKFLSKKPKK